MSDAYDALLKYRKQTATLQSCAGILGWDQETYMPAGAGELRASQLAVLSGMAHARATATEYRDLLAAAEEAGAADGSLEASNLREIRREYDLSVKLPRELVEELARTHSMARQAWVAARPENDFASFLPWLEKNIDLARRQADALGWKEHPYDALIDQSEPGETTASMNESFAPLRDFHADLVARILDSGVTVDTGPVHRVFPIDAQKTFGRRAAEAIGFDFHRGRLDVTAHPFCSGAGPTDVRLTTRYTETFFPEAFFGTLHEAGHGIYEQGLLPERFGTPAGESVSLGIHESQSRMWENLVGRSRGFWKHFYPAAQEQFPGALGGVGMEAFWRAINDVRPSLIRVEADEVTYNLHVFLRFELEQAMISGDLSAADLPGGWNETFARYLQLKVPSDADGCMQDVHWSMGLIGYFATYALGNLYASQIFEQAQSDLGDLQAAFSNGEFAPLKRWLNENIHQHGKHFRPRELVEQVTGRPPSPEPLKHHLESKYGEIYGL